MWRVGEVQQLRVRRRASMYLRMTDEMEYIEGEVEELSEAELDIIEA